MSVNNIFIGGNENFLISYMLQFWCDKWNFKPCNTKLGTLEQLSDSWPRNVRRRTSDSKYVAISNVRDLQSKSFRLDN